MKWQVTNRADRAAARIADRHYSRQSHGTRQFSPPGRVLVLVTPDYGALWVTSWPYAQYVNRLDYKGAWICSLFRNETPERYLSSDLISEAVAATRWRFGEAPADGMVTMVDMGKTRRKRDPGRCFRRAGFQPCGMTLGGLLVLRLAPGDMPPAAPAQGAQLSLWDTHPDEHTA